MPFYRPSRNLEASLIQYIQDQLEFDNWTNVTVEKSFNRAMNIPIDAAKGSAVICVRASDTNRSRFEIGTDNIVRKQLMLLDVFASSDGQRLDLVDFLGCTLKCGFPYYEYEVERGVVVNKIQYGRVTVLDLTDTPVNFNIDKASLDVIDRYRHSISFSVSTGKVE